jgi:hypothetical protein
MQGNELWPTVEAIANGLLINGELAGCEITDIMQNARRLTRGRTN